MSSPCFSWRVEDHSARSRRSGRAPIPRTCARIPQSPGGVPWLPTWLLSRASTRFSTSRRPTSTSICYASDPPLRDAVRAMAAAATRRRCRHSASTGAAPRCSSSARQANENPPKLKTFDAKGFRRDIVEFHPAYHELHGREHRAPACRPRPGATTRRRGRARARCARGALLHGGAGRDRTHVPDHHDARRGRGARGRAARSLAKLMPQDHVARATTRVSFRGGRRPASRSAWA